MREFGGNTQRLEQCSRKIVGKSWLDRNGQMKMEAWLPPELGELLVAEHNRPNSQKTNIAIVKFFNPSGPGTWWASELEPETGIFFGKAELFCKEYGSFSLEELRSLRLPFGLFIERDYYFIPKPLEEC